MTPPDVATASARTAPRVGYLPGLDGLRAVSVIAVILFHAGVTRVNGGFLGVEVFFVISGYLITSLLLAERHESGRISLRSFWARRARRLLPALYVLLAVVTAVTLVFFADDAAALRGDVIAALLYVINWFFIVTEKSYFEVIGRPPLLQHLWSLAVEEQFYLLWPVIFGLGMKVLTRKRMLICILAGAVASAVLMAVLYVPGADASRVYYGTDTRAQGLLMGAALAFVWAPWLLHGRTGKGAPVVLDLTGIAGLAALAWVFVSVSEYRDADRLYRGGFLALDLLTVVLIAVTVHPAARLVPAVLGSRPLRWIGQRSYGLYLWHWPVFVLTRPDLDIDLDGPALFVVRMVITVALTELSYRFIEQPIRHGALGRAWTRMRSGDAPARLRLAFGGALAASAITVVVLGAGLADATKPAPPEFLAMADQTIPGLPTAGAAPVGGVSPDSSATVGPDGNPVASVADGTTPDGSSPDGTAPDASSLPATTAPPPPPPPTTQPPLVPPSMAGQPMSAVGDSVMLGASGAIRQVFGAQMGVDAVVGRQATQAIEVLRVRHDFATLGNLVIIHIGNNGYVTLPQCQKMLDLVAEVPRVLLVTVKVPREWEGEVNDTINQCAQGHPNTVLVDWHAASVDHPEYFYDDGMHLQQPGAIAYVSLLANAAG